MSGGAICGVCNEVEETPLVPCIECMTEFHLNLRKDRPGKDCGDAILGESMGVEMICNHCIERQRAGPDRGGGLLSMYAAMTEGRFLPPGLAPRQPPQPSPPRPVRPASKPADGDRPRRRFRRIDR